MQNQSQQTPQNIVAQNAKVANARYQQEFASSELAQAPGQISKMLLANSKAGFEFGNVGNAANKATANANQANANAQYEFGNMNNAAMANAQMNQNSELNQSAGQISQVLRQQSR
jgi:hypothetical protein